MSFRREKYVPAGGPDGGDGGSGGEVVVVADSSDVSLTSFRERRRFVAENGRPGAGSRRTGRDGAPLLLHVPAGTLVRERDRVLADLDHHGASVVVARGGRGGRGNARFTTATRQAPRVGELGEPGEHRHLVLELKLIADVGLVGLPNAGKSTLLAALTGAHPKIAGYPFTTLHPNLGVAEVDSRPVVIADVPGLIAGAHRGAGLGLGFLRHLERTRVLVHVVDASLGVDAAESAMSTVDSELRWFSGALAARPALLAFNKCDVAAGEAAAATLVARHTGAFAVSAAARIGLGSLLEAAAGAAARAVEEGPPATARPRHRVYRRIPRDAQPLRVVREAGGYRVSAPDVEVMVAMTDLDSDEAVARLQRRLRDRGVDAALAAAGCADGDDVVIGGFEFTYLAEH